MCFDTRTLLDVEAVRNRDTAERDLLYGMRDGVVHNLYERETRLDLYD